jgi:hypothetical protein
LHPANVEGAELVAPAVPDQVERCKDDPVPQLEFSLMLYEVNNRLTLSSIGL